MRITFDCVIEKGKSEKTGKHYVTLEIVELGKKIFLTDTEIKLLSLLHPITPDNKE